MGVKQIRSEFFDNLMRVPNGVMVGLSIHLVTADENTVDSDSFYEEEELLAA